MQSSPFPFIITYRERYWPDCFYTEIKIIAGAGRYDGQHTEGSRQYREPKGGQGEDRKIIKHPHADIAIIQVIMFNISVAFALFFVYICSIEWRIWEHIRAIKFNRKHIF